MPSFPAFQGKKAGKHGSSTLCIAGDFEPEKHYYPRVLNAQIHPVVNQLLHLSNDRIIARFAQLYPTANRHVLRELLNYTPEYFKWAGSDLLHATTSDGRRRMVCIETNSCPSGQKSMPLADEDCQFGGYRSVLERTFNDIAARADPQLGALAVVYDKNPMEASGYANVMASVFGEPVLLAEFYDSDPDPPVKWEDGVMFVRHPQSHEWVSIRAAFRYVTQRPWLRFPTRSRTLILNPIVACLAGGRNKAMAALAYGAFNEQYREAGLRIRTPHTSTGIRKADVPAIIDAMGGHGVIKVPYANAGQGIYTITRQQELADFMAERHPYDRFIVQSLIGNPAWSSTTTDGCFHHVGTVPNERGETFVADLRVMVSACSADGFKPVALYARRARKPLADVIEPESHVTTWDMLGTNLSIKDAAGNWTTASNRLVMMDRKDFGVLGLGIDELIEAYLQTVFSVVAIDHMCKRLMTSDGFDYALFNELNPDEDLMREINEASAACGAR